MNLIFCLTILIAVGHIKCDLPQIKVNITDNEDQFITATKVLFAKLDWLIVEIDGITKRLNQQDEIINQLPTKTDISEVVKTDVVELNVRIFQKLNQQDENSKQLPTKAEIIELINTNITELNQQIFQKLQEQDEKNNQQPTKAEISEVMKLNQQVFQKFNQQDEHIKQLPTKGEIGEVLEHINTNITELNQQIFQKLNQQDEKINQLSTKGEIGEVLELINTNVTELNQQIFQKLNQQDEIMKQLPTKAEINELMKLSIKQESEISEVLEKVNATIPAMSKNESFNRIVNEKLQNLLLKYNISYSKPTEEINKMLSKQTIKEMGNWLVILRRQDGSEDFDRNWLDYQIGFGNPTGEFFIGLEKLHAITTKGGRHELLIILKDFEGVTKYANYDHFVVGDETEKYELQKLGEYDGDAGNSMRWLLNKKFTTKGHDNDLYDENFAVVFKGGWWFGDYSLDSLLTGPYYHKPTLNVGRGIVWYHWHGFDYSLKFVEMMVRLKA